MVKRKEEITGISFTRAVLTVLIVMYHFLGAAGEQYSILDRYCYPPWNSMTVTGFFVISGAVLFYNHDEIPSLKEFYFKRAKSIYPAFYIAYAYYFVMQAFENGDIFPHGQPWCLIFSLLGIDGYLELRVPNYYLIGEWFLGAIIILYLFYPVLLKCIKKTPVISGVLIVTFYLIFNKTKFFTYFPMRNIFTCMMSFYFGMLIIKYNHFFLNCKWIAIVSLIYLFVSGRFFIIPIDSCTITQINGYALFFILYYFGKFAMNWKQISSIVSVIGKLSYPIYLVHHMIVNKMINYRIPGNSLEFIIMFIITFSLSFIAAKALALLTASVIKSELFRKFEEKILG